MTEKLSALNAGGWFDFSMNRQPRCPHCGSDFDITDNEAWHLFDQNETHTVECPVCDLPFYVNSHAVWSFSTDEQEDDE
jgi:uncharacterized protein with PIN domain